MPGGQAIIRKTQSFCPECFQQISASVVERSGSIYLDKSCAKHGPFSLLLSRHADYYRALHEFYFSRFNRSYPQRDYILNLTNKCQLNCPICLANANLIPAPDYDLASLKDFLKGKRGYKIDLMGAEPTTRTDLQEIISLIENSGNTAALHTNGIRIAEYAYLAQLKKSGLRRISLQFDGFDDAVYEKLRGQKLLALKTQALKNLKKANIATDLVVTVARNVNEPEMSKILQFALGQKFIKGVFFLGYRFMGKARKLPPDYCIMPDELIDILEKQTQGKISRQGVFNFQKLYFAFLSAFSLRKCFYIHHFLVFRLKNSYLGADQILNLQRLYEKLDNYRQLRQAKSKFAAARLIVSLAKELLGRRFFFWVKEILAFGLWSAKLANLPGGSLLVGFISSCDAYSFDSAIAENCGKGTLSLELGRQESGALNNIMADKAFAAKKPAL